LRASYFPSQNVVITAPFGHGSESALFDYSYFTEPYQREWLGN
jgi:hypothetical protein